MVGAIEKDFARNDQVDIVRVIPSPDNPRKHFDPDGLRELSESIRIHGIIEPIVVREVRPERYEIIAGERRWRAAKTAGLQNVPVRILANVDEKQARELRLVENLIRRDLDPIEEAQGFRELVNMGRSVAEVGQAVSRSESEIRNKIRLLELPEPILNDISAGRLTPTHGRALVPYVQYPQMLNGLAEAARKGVSTKDIENLNYTALITHWHNMELNSLATYSAKFDTADCQKCEHKRKFWCLDTKCFEAKNKLAKENKARELEKQARAVAGGNGEIALTEIDMDDYANLGDNPPAGCDPKCEFRKLGQAHDKSLRAICLDPKCCTQLRQAETEKRKMFRINDSTARLNIAVDNIHSPEVVDLVAAVALQGMFWRFNANKLRNTLGAAVEHLGLSIDYRKIAQYVSRPAEYAEQLNELAKVPAARLMMLLTEAIARDEAIDALSGYSDYGALTWLTDKMNALQEGRQPVEIGMLEEPDPDPETAAGKVEPLKIPQVGTIWKRLDVPYVHVVEVQGNAGDAFIILETLEEEGYPENQGREWKWDQGVNRFEDNWEWLPITRAAYIEERDAEKPELGKDPMEQFKCNRCNAVYGQNTDSIIRQDDGTMLCTKCDAEKKAKADPGKQDWQSHVPFGRLANGEKLVKDGVIYEIACAKLNVTCPDTSQSQIYTLLWDQDKNEIKVDWSTIQREYLPFEKALFIPCKADKCEPDRAYVSNPWAGPLRIVVSNFKPIEDAYSADMYDKGKIRPPFKYCGRLWMNSGGIYHGDKREGDCWELIPLSLCNGKTFTHAELVDLWSENEDDRGNLNGMLVEWGRLKWVVRGPEVTFSNHADQDAGRELGEVA